MKITKSELVTINVPNGTTALKFYFPDNSVLRTSANQLVKTKGLEFYPAESVAYGPDGTTAMTSTDIAQGYLVLYIDNDGGEYIKIPLNKLVSTFNNTSQGWPGDTNNYPHVFEVPEFDDLMVNWPKSYVFFPTALQATGVSINCTVYYQMYKR